MNFNVTTWYSNWISQRHVRKLSRLADRVLAKDLGGADLEASLQAAKGLAGDEALVGVFATVREAVYRHTGLRLHKAQILGGLVLTAHRVAEMKTGEGKTLTLVAPVVWRALAGHGVHVVTANPYLAERDSAALRPIYEALGLTVGCVLPQLDAEARRTAYACSVTYGVNHEFGFDYLRDLRAKDRSDRVQRGLASAFVDELDAVLIDDARTPLILSGAGEDRSVEYRVVYDVARRLEPGVDYVVEERERSASLTDRGYARSEAMLVEEGLLSEKADLYATANNFLATALTKAVQARSLYLKGRDYLVASDEVVLLDSTTGRTMNGRRLEEGLHEMLEVKESVRVQPGTRVLGAITYQNFFSLYSHLCGLTGTAFTEAEELLEVYGLETVVVPTHRPVRRDERPDMLLATRAEKISEAVQIALDCASSGQPLLIGTGTVRDAYAVADALQAAGLQPSVLTAEHVADEAKIVARAGARGALTVATSVAGRGTDIALGGHGATGAETQAVNDLGGLFVLGFGRNALRRVDLQLIGRCARQGDRGTSQFLLCLEDDLLRSFAGNATLRRATAAFAGTNGLAGTLVSRLVGSAQASAERQGSEARQQLQKFDAVVGEQRSAFFGWRETLLDETVAQARFCEGAEQVAGSFVHSMLAPDADRRQWPLLELKKRLRAVGIEEAPVMAWADDAHDVQDIAEKAGELARNAAAQVLPERAKAALLLAADEGWSAHLAGLDEMQFSVQLASKIGKNPSFEFSHRAYQAFQGLVKGVAEVACTSVLKPADTEAVARPALSAKARVAAALDSRWVGRNDACPCGSSRRFKLCHGRLF